MKETGILRSERGPGEPAGGEGNGGHETQEWQGTGERPLRRVALDCAQLDLPVIAFPAISPGDRN